MNKKTLWQSIYEKIIWSLISTKLWAYIAYFIVSTVLVYNGFLEGDTWATSCISIYGMAFGMRELSKSRVDVSLSNKKKSEDSSYIIGDE